jgi:hypothetical protein
MVATMSGKVGANSLFPDREWATLRENGVPVTWARARFKHPAGADPSEWPADLRAHAGRCM